ncbi:IclR family transcriptional regulator [Streptomyces violaceusniger]|uniref:IclR family transcriptional regulator n=1 Tax=Streptomyces violaceusniger TaxID=68280 RepID=UPI0009974132|nr:IclR family transcriptional regulator [Streptomyces hygroscopicus]AQW48460.1 IclR family transcriptional regulator [Streptomyces hygroscopicus]
MSDSGVDGKTLLRTLERGLKMLEAIADYEGGATAKELSSTLDIKLGTCYHLLRTLVTNGYVSRLSSGRYGIGHRVNSLSRRLQERPGFYPGPSPYLSALLDRLNARTHETSSLSGWVNGRFVLQRSVPGPRGLRIRNLEIGYADDLHARASSKAVLAFLHKEQIADMFPGVTLKARTRNTITDYDELLGEFARVRRRGYALDLEEFSWGTCCISAAFFDQSRIPRGSFSVSVPRARFHAARAAALVRQVQEVAALASDLLRARKISPEGPNNGPGSGRQQENDEAESRY